MSRHDRAYGEWRTTRQKGKGHQGRRTTGHRKTTGTASDSPIVKTVDVEALLAYVRGSKTKK